MSTGGATAAGENTHNQFPSDSNCHLVFDVYIIRYIETRGLKQSVTFLFFFTILALAVFAHWKNNKETKSKDVYFPNEIQRDIEQDDTIADELSTGCSRSVLQRDVLNSPDQSDRVGLIKQYLQIIL